MTDFYAGASEVEVNAFLIIGGLGIWAWIGMRVFDLPDEHEVTPLELFLGGPIVWLCWVIAWIRRLA